MSYTLAITSADRFDLLERSFLSFMENADVQPSAICIINDGPAEMPEFLKRFRHIPTTWLTNDSRRGQVHCLDRLYREVKTPYVFHTEDDFEFTGGNFIRKSFELLEKYPSLALVSLRTDWGHPVADGDCAGFPDSLKIAMPYWNNWGGWTWNPSVRRLKDIKRFGPVAKYGRQNGLEHEALMSKAFLDAGFRIAIGPKVCHHIGDGRSKACEKIEIAKEPRILIAIKAGRSLNYTRWESEKSPHFDPSLVGPDGPYCTSDKPIHVSSQYNPRLAAVHATWFQDIKSYPNVECKFFFGQDSGKPGHDEVVLPVPDGYAHLSDKTKAICEWALFNNFDYAFLCDDDTAVYVDRLVEEIRGATWDYAGHLNGNVATGGSGYILSARAMREVVRNFHRVWCEDVSVAKTLFYAGIEAVNLIGHKSGGSDHHFFTGDKFDPTLLKGDEVAMHAVFPDVMRQWWEHKNT